MCQLAALQLHDKLRHAAWLAFEAVRKYTHSVAFHRSHFGLKRAQPIAQHGIVDRAAHADAFFLHQPHKSLEAIFQGVRIAQHAPLVAQRCIGNEPALAPLADNLSYRHPYLRKEGLIEFRMTSHRL